LTFNGGGQPLWSPDGKRIVYGGGRLWQLDADGGGKPEVVTTSDANQIPSSWSSANTIAFMQRPTSGTSGIWALAMTDRTPKLFLESRFSLWYPEFSPDGRLMAYASNESSASEIYVQPFPGPGAKIRISTSGGSEPLWAPNGRELLYRSFSAGRQQVFTVAIRSTSPLQADAPRLLFDVAPPQFDGTLPTRSWDVSPDGKRFLMLKLMPAPDKAVTTMHVVLNWSEELKRLVPAK
jgi:Tol biopolymer transport system component